MASIISPNPEQLKEISNRFIQHQLCIEEIIKSVNSDAELFVPPFTDVYPTEDNFHQIITHLQTSSNILGLFRNMIEKCLNEVCIPDECLDISRWK